MSFKRYKIYIVIDIYIYHALIEFPIESTVKVKYTLEDNGFYNRFGFSIRSTTEKKILYIEREKVFSLFFSGKTLKVEISFDVKFFLRCQENNSFLVFFLFFSDFSINTSSFLFFCSGVLRIG
jgi:hypothetical protein